MPQSTKENNKRYKPSSGADVALSKLRKLTGTHLIHTSSLIHLNKQAPTKNDQVHGETPAITEAPGKENKSEHKKLPPKNPA
ncbi:hypothetical protein MRX58_12635 (plasmid) [Xylella fastidiosa subsp. pauca]|uniref:hypothetical protein n=1 Tax=Xylella fastidiosa TaxID=2371 RepID=UPI00241D44CC|nr:hypothetical protein [Xylella fastidiosa]MDG5824324.1 hypothetical protein [Xylella fastidiosa subsp. pauca]MDG5824362.1 hypothetical protein [Xylella fastidiosa subsp. pauca]MDG5826944.1 hypothetical protein [Xylella fastidiosa subsp. pauca]MDG5826986.1 hypothetical protein [Xylella fastidiosa subsp. pauca]